MKVSDICTCKLPLTARLTVTIENSSNQLASGINANTNVIENSKEYGGGGYRYANMATTSLHDLGLTVTIHKLGHSLFELADEYSSSPFGLNSPNCATAGCSKWSDLDED
jgi:hypothetical protein